MVPPPAPQVQQILRRRLKQRFRAADQSLQRSLAFLGEHQRPGGIEDYLNVGPAGVTGPVQDAAGPQQSLGIGSIPALRIEIRLQPGILQSRWARPPTEANWMREDTTGSEGGVIEWRVNG
jgi:hypothetical protein